MNPRFRRFLLIPFLIVLPVLFIGCQSFYNAAKTSRATAVDLAYGGYEFWTNYYCLKTNQANISAQELQSLEAARSQLKETRLRFAASVNTLDSWLEAYKTNSAVKPQVQAILDSTLNTASNFVWLVNYFQQQHH